MSTPDARALRRFLVVALVLPAVLVLVAVCVQLAVRPSLPDPIAIHWGAAGEPDGFGPFWVAPTVTTVLGFGLPLLFAVPASGSLRRGDGGTIPRALGAAALAESVFLCVLLTWTVVMQAGLADARDAPGIIAPLLVSVLAAALAAAAGWFLQPRPTRRTLASERGTPPPRLPTTERTVWLRSVRMERSGVFVLAAVFALLVFLIVLLSSLPDAAGGVGILVGVTVLMAGVTASMSVFRVRIDGAGLAVDSAVGWPRVRIPLDDIRSVEAVPHVSPMGEFGGWGMRWALGGGSGVVLRSGPGIRVQRRSGRVFTVTVDDAESGAALLQALVERPPAAR